MASCGKRKRSTRERPPALSSSMECDTSPSSPRVPLALSKLSIRDDPLPSSIPTYPPSSAHQMPMDMVGFSQPTVSSSSLSSSESDTGIFTNDEGREGRQFLFLFRNKAVVKFILQTLRYVILQCFVRISATRSLSID